ncbi:uncharacterized protein LOC118433952 [Folsomia candida]|uniref:uncharacterized protein LOC118433952 n=1 Tax=Folsomia candida TaxID=158441 RepID=UPI0016053A2F|nr:uncharacterized protein LOC118433952 [Folsomia candida]
MRIFIPLSNVSIMGLVLLKFVLLTFAPCTPPFILSMLSDCKVLKGQFEFWELLGLHLFESWMLWQMIFAGSWLCLYIIFVGIDCFLSYLRVLERQIGRISPRSEIEADIGLYRMIQILEKQYNALLMHRTVPALLICCPGLQTIVQYVCISHHEDIAMPGFLAFPLMGLNAIIVNIL